MPLDSGTRTITATPRSLASLKNKSAGRWRKMLKMIWTLATAGYSSALIPFLDLLDADAVPLELAGLDQTIEGRERLRLVVDLRWRAVQLDEIERIGLEIAEAAVDEGGQILPAVPGGIVRVEATAGLGRDDRLFAARLQRTGDPLLGAPVTIDIGGVDEVDPAIERGIEGGGGILVAHRPPVGAERPAAEPDFADIPPGAADMSRLHG